MQAVPCYTLLQRIEEYTEDEHEDLIIPIAAISAVDVQVEGPSAPWLIDELPAWVPLRSSESGDEFRHHPATKMDIAEVISGKRFRTGKSAS